MRLTAQWAKNVNPITLSRTVNLLVGEQERGPQPRTAGRPAICNCSALFQDSRNRAVKADAL